MERNDLQSYLARNLSGIAPSSLASRALSTFAPPPLNIAGAQRLQQTPSGGSGGALTGFTTPAPNIGGATRLNQTPMTDSRSGALTGFTPPPPNMSGATHLNQTPNTGGDGWVTNGGGGNLEQMPRFLTMDQLRQRMGGHMGGPGMRDQMTHDGDQMRARSDQMRALVADMITKIRAGQPIGGIDELRKQFFG